MKRTIEDWLTISHEPSDLHLKQKFSPFQFHLYGPHILFSCLALGDDCFELETTCLCASKQLLYSQLFGMCFVNIHRHSILG